MPVVGVSTSVDEVFQSGSIAIAHIYRAKGNEAPMVYAIDSHQVYRIDSQTGRSVPIEFDAPDLPRIREDAIEDLPWALERVQRLCDPSFGVDVAVDATDVLGGWDWIVLLAVSTSLVCAFNVSNCLAAASVAVEAGIDLADVKAGLDEGLEHRPGLRNIGAHLQRHPRRRDR